MRARTIASVALLASVALAGCGPTLFDSRGVPVVTPTCLDPALPIACLGADACVAEDDRHCGASCNDCLATPFAHATSFCDRSAVDVGLHACTYACDVGYERDPFGPGCRTALCAAPQVQCGTACFTESVSQCGTRCLDCTDPSNVVPPGGSAACLGAPGNGTCTFACPDGFLKSNGACVQIAAGAGSVALGASHTCVITTAGGVMCWGANDSGQLGLGDVVNRLVPTDVTLSGGATARFIAAGVSHTCAVTATGDVQCWGSNASGQLGLALTTKSSVVPTPITSLTGANTVAAGARHTCALMAGSGSVVCWGANDKGQVGLNPVNFPLLTNPTPVNLSGAVRQLVTQTDHTCAIKDTKGQVCCWGANSLGQSGQSVSPNAPGVPGAWVSSLTATSISVGGSHTCAVGAINNANPGLYCWGDRSSGQLGSGSSGFTSTPVLAVNIAPLNGSGVTTVPDLVLTGRAHTCDARSVDGLAACAGANNALQVGQTPPSTIVLRSSPDVSVGAPVDALFGGGDRGCALSAGVLRCWGANDQGQLGDGSTLSSAAPVSPRPF